MGRLSLLSAQSETRTPAWGREQPASVARQHATHVQVCYDELLSRLPQAAGEVRLSVTLTPEGSVTKAAVSSALAQDAVFAMCLRSALLVWVYPPTGGKSAVVVHSVFGLQPAAAVPAVAPG